MGKRGRGLGAGATILVVLLGLALSACTPIIRSHGYVPTDEVLANVIIGQDSRETVAELVGTPSSEGVATDSASYYVASRFRHYGPLAPEEIERQVLVIDFSSQGIVTNISRFGLEAGRVVVLSRRVTDDNLGDVSFLRQLLGGIGRISAADIIGSD